MDESSNQSWEGAFPVSDGSGRQQDAQDSLGKIPKNMVPEDLGKLKFMQNFDPEKSSRNQQKKKKRYHHNDGRLIQYADAIDYCDCLRPNCVGCHYKCRICTSTKCGHDCRTERRWAYESVEVEGRNLEFKNLHMPAHM